MSVHLYQKQKLYINKHKKSIKAIPYYILLLQKCRDHRSGVVACFIDYEKAFDCVIHVKLIEALQIAEIDQRYMQIIKKSVLEPDGKYTSR